MKKKNGFTLIELLAVIIILGILMIIAIPSVTKYINDSRKNAYVNTAKEIISGARNLVNEGKLEMFDTNTTYYIPASCIKTENAQKSPYGEFDKAYVLVTYNGKGYNYYWVSRDETGQGVPDPIAIENLDEDDIVSDISFDYIKEDKPQEEKNTIKVIDKDNCNEFVKDSTAAEQILETALAANQLNQIPDTDIYIFKGGTTNPPANYVKFNCTDSSDTSTCEDWRIIGIYNGQMKIIRVGSNGQPTAPTGFTSIAWNTTTPNPGWANSSLKESLNTTYYNTLSDTAKGMIDENGSWDVGPAAYNAIAKDAYTQATTSGTVVGSTTHTTPWTGKVGLMASYEFLYASGGGDTCLTTSGYNYSSVCGTEENDWLKPGNISFALSADSNNANQSIGLFSNGGFVSAIRVDKTRYGIPAVFLKSSVRVASGDGTSGNPYILNLE